MKKAVNVFIVSSKCEFICVWPGNVLIISNSLLMY